MLREVGDSAENAVSDATDLIKGNTRACKARSAPTLTHGEAASVATTGHDARSNIQAGISRQRFVDNPLNVQRKTETCPFSTTP